MPGAAAALGTGIGAAGTAVLARAGVDATAEAIRNAILVILAQTADALNVRLREQLKQLLLERYPQENLAAFYAEEERRAEVFKERMEERVRAGLRGALSLPSKDEELARLRAEVQRLEQRPGRDPQKLEALRWELSRAEFRDGARERAVRGILRQEERYIAQRSSAVMARGIAFGERIQLKRISPQGAYWKPDPFVKEHTAGCLIMMNRLWPWIVLDRVHPPRHPACPCRLISYGAALSDGLIRPDTIVPSEEQAIALSAGVMMEGEAEALVILLALEGKGDEAARLILRG